MATSACNELKRKLQCNNLERYSNIAIRLVLLGGVTECISAAGYCDRCYRSVVRPSVCPSVICLPVTFVHVTHPHVSPRNIVLVRGPGPLMGAADIIIS